MIVLATALAATVVWPAVASAAKPQSKAIAAPAFHAKAFGGKSYGAESVSKGRTGASTVRSKAGAPVLGARLAFSGTPVSRKLMKGGKVRYVSVSRGISCVPFARSASGINLKGNATNWWDAADGVYERGSRPEAGSVLNFRSTGRMRLGHVAVVAAVVNSREVQIDHANWAGPGNYGNVARGVSVVDVSEANDWSAVRVALGRTGDYGSVYPVYGFIYDRPDRGVMLANTGLGRAPARLSAYEEVAEAPARPRRGGAR